MLKNWASDVLLRHVKYFHGQDNSSNDTQSNPESAVEQNQTVRRGSTTENEVEKSGDNSNGLLNQGDNMSQNPPAIDATVSTDQLITSELDALAAATLLQARNQGLNGDSGFAITQPSLEGTHENHPDTLPEPTAAQDLVVPDLTTSSPEMINGSTDFHVMLSGGTDFVQSSLMISNGFSNDLEACQGVLDLFHANFNSLDFLNLSAANGNSPTLTSSQFASTERAGSIPLERFAQVARLWPSNRSRLADDGAARIWIDVVGYRGDNILTDIFISETSPTPSIGKENESKWGLDEDKRQELVHEFVPDALSSTSLTASVYTSTYIFCEICAEFGRLVIMPPGACTFRLKTSQRLRLQLPPSGDSKMLPPVGNAVIWTGKLGEIGCTSHVCGGPSNGLVHLSTCGRTTIRPIQRLPRLAEPRGPCGTAQDTKRVSGSTKE
ncbi:hypothetical protein NW755_007075 [Fusarium falciforme]|uniref:Uncharacterized protein n=1 Tax=Fusarium falciforme TaxID=195108 RepID=A0A9W8V1T0_9HYPO|nr:hypothetical protein NW755_007075 [Fusarium falciforme]